MVLFYAVHYPQPDKEHHLIQRMQQFGERIKEQPGVIFVDPTPFRDAQHGTLIALCIWETQQAFEAAWPTLVQYAPSEEWEVKPREVYLFPEAV